MRLIYFSPVSANAYAQRPHFMVQSLLKLGMKKVLWINPYPCRLPRLDDFIRIRGSYSQSASLDSRITVLDVPALPIEPLPGGTWLNRLLLWRNTWKKLTDFAGIEQTTILGIGRPGALALAALNELPLYASFYDAMDVFPEFHRGLSRKATRYHEESIAAKVTLLLASSSHIYAKYAKRGLNVKKVLNAYPMATLPPWKPSNHTQTVLGYLGCLGSWFDWSLVFKIARQLPQVQIELVGPLHVSPPSELPSNIRLYPACKQSEAATHLSRFSAGLIPFRTNPLTDGVDPIKYYEYRAAGLPVLSTSFGEMTARTTADGVYFLDQTNDFTSVVGEALKHRDDDAIVSNFRRDHDWNERFIIASPFTTLLNPRIRQHAA